MMRVRTFGVLAWLTVALAGCPALLQDFTIGSGSDSGNDGTVGADVGGGGDGTFDAAACLARQVDAQNGVFVLAGSSGDEACGDITAPCATVQLGIDRAQSLGKTEVYVAASTYVESIVLRPNMTVEGGWHASGSTWTPVCTSGADGAVVIQAPPTENMTVLADKLAGTVTMRMLTVKSKQSNVQPGESLYGVFARDPSTTLVLEDVVVQLVAAGDGSAGGPGNAGANAASGCVTSNGSTGAHGGAGAPGVGAGTGNFSAAGYLPGGGGGIGGTGGAGNAGTAGGLATCHSPCTTGCPSNCMTFYCTSGCPTDGTAGCGGSGGTGGSAGTGGGASVAVYVWQAHVSASNGALVAGSGGVGGSGGQGGPGGAASGGAAGGCGCCGLCGSAPGVAGGPGGAGGTGGQGGGGAGGWSCAYYVDSSGSVMISGTQLTHGAAGSGGQAGGAAGVASGRCP